MNALGPHTQDALHSALADERLHHLYHHSSDVLDRMEEEDEEAGLHYIGYYGLDGEQISRRVAFVLMESPQKCLRQEWLHVRDRLRVWISTVWIGLDHNFMRMMRDYPGETEYDTRPWIFETMVFHNSPHFDDVHARIGYSTELLQWRYATIEEALAGHEAAIEEVKSETGTQ